MGQRAIIIYCGLLMAASAVSIDVILPAFARMAGDLDAAYTSVQLVVPIFIFSAGVGQFFWGSLSDKYGRKPILQIGLLGFVLGSILCVLANTIELMLAGRAIQGLCVASGSVISRAILRDMFSGAELARNMAFATMIFALGPIIGPVMGAGVLAFASWRYILLVILLFGAGLLAIALFRYEETIAKKNPKATNWDGIKRNFLAVLQNPQSRFFILMSGPISALIIFILISLPRVMWEEYKIDGATFALLFAIHGFGIIIGQFLNRRLIHLYGVKYALNTGASILFASAILVVLINLIGLMDYPVLIFALTILATSHLIVVSNATSLTLDPHGSIAGFVASMFGFISQMVAALIGFGLAMIVGGSVIYLGVAMLFITSFNLLMIHSWSRISNV